MFRMNDIILLLVIFSSMVAGIMFPGFAKHFQPYPLFLMMFLLFLSFLPIKLDDIWLMIRHNGPTIIWLSLLKMIAIPLIVYYLFKTFYPSYAVAALLLTGISTGVVAPFISALVNANGPLVLIMVVTSSLIVPFTLPALVKIVLERNIEISFWGMTQILSMVIFFPVIAVQIFRRVASRLLESLTKKRFAISLIIFAAINLGVFSKYADYFRQNPGTVIEAVLVAIVLGGIYLVVGLLSQWGSSVSNQLAAVITLGNVNNVLVLVFASEFFGPLEPTLAAMYMIPFFGLIFPMRVYQRLKGTGQIND